MSREIDERVVSMEFDNRNFESNVKTSMSTLEKLKQSLNFKGATTGLSEIDNASKKINFSAMGKAVDEIGIRFNALQVVATTALANITNSVVNAGKQMVNALAVEPLTSGFAEYETQIGAIQTILSNTRSKGTTLDQVNDALDQLNTYADQTIYNFTEMTRNIGTFTAAGVDLDRSVAAIKGIANLGAVSGSTSAQVSTAMYQLSQALATGKVSLMDWNSVVNAGMGGEVFQEALKRTSRVLNTGVDAAIEKYGTFRDSLTKGEWLTSDVLIETLKQISGAYTEADLISQGYTEEQAKEITALADDAVKAATQVKTFSQLMDTTREQLGSGWTNTWELIVGNFEEARGLFTEVSNTIGNMVQEDADARNNLLQGWKDLGGRDALIDGITNAFNALLSVIKPIQEAFQEIFPPATSEQLYNLTTQFRDFMQSLILDEEASGKLRDAAKSLFNVFKLLGEGVGQVINFMSNFTEHASAAIDAVLEFITSIGNFAGTFAETLKDGSAFSTIIEQIGTAFGEAASGVGEFFSSGLGKLGEVINSITPDQINTALNAIATGGLVTLVSSIKDALSGLGGSVEDIGSSLTDTLKSLTGGFSSSITSLLDAVRGALEAWQQNIKSTALLKIAAAVALLANAIAQLASLDPQGLRDSLGAVTVLFGELIATMTAFERLSAGMSFGMSGAVGLISMAFSINILADALTKVANLDQDAITRGIEGLAGLAAIMVLAAKALGIGGKTALKGAGQLVVMAAAMKIFASVVADLSVLDMDKMKNALITLGILMGEIALYSMAVKSSGLFQASVSMIAIAAAMKIMVGVVNDIGNIDTGKATQGVAVIGALLLEIGGFSRLADGKTLLASFVPMLSFAVALIGFAQSISMIASLDSNQAGMAVSSLSIVLAEIVAMSKLMPNTAKLLGLAVALPALSSSLVIIAAAINLLAGLSIEQVGTALAGFVGSMVSLFIGIKAVSGNAKSVLVLMLAATALTTMAAAIKILSTVGIAGVAVSLGTLAGTFIILGSAAKLLGPLAPSMFKISAAIASFGVALVAIGVGSAAIGTGLGVALAALAASFLSLQQSISQMDPQQTAVAILAVAAGFAVLAAAAHFLGPLVPNIVSLSISIAAFGLGCAAVAASISLLVAAFEKLGSLNAEGIASGVNNFGALLVGIIDLIPTVLAGLGEALKSVILTALDVLVTVAPQIADSVLKVITEVLASLNEYAPQIIDFVLTFIIQIINGVAARIPELVDSISNLVSSLFTAIFDALSGWTGTEDATSTALNFLAGATGLVVAFNAIKGMIPGAMAGALEMGAFIAEIGIILAAFGALQQIPGLNWLITEGGNLLQSIGTALGQFIGGIVAGLAEGATSTLPQVGTNLSDFMTNLEPFITGVKMIDPATMTAIDTLVNAILKLTAANVLDAVASFISGGTDLGEFGQKLIPFGEAIQEFSSTVSGIDTAAVTAAAQAGEALAALATALPKEGGLAQAIFGESTDMDEFGAQMVGFGLALKFYGAAVAGLNVEEIVSSAQAGQALSDLATSLPKDGGLAQGIFGENTDMDEFGGQLVAFGFALRMYAASVANLDVTSIQTSVQAGQALADLASSLPDSGGLTSWLFGDNEIGDFGTSLVQFGDALGEYATSLADINFTKISNATNAVRSLSTVINNALEIDTSGIDNLMRLEDIGTALNNYWNKISKINMTDLTTSTSALTSLRDLISNLVGLDTSGISSFSEALSQLGQVSLNSLVSVFQNASLQDQGFNLAQTFGTGFQSGFQGVTTTMTNIFNNFGTLLDLVKGQFLTKGYESAQNVATGIQNGSSLVGAQITAMMQNATNALSGYEGAFYAAGSNLAIGFANGISSSAYRASVASRAMANAAKTAAEQALDEHSPSKVMQQIGEYAGEGFTIGIENYIKPAETIGESMASAVVRGASTVADLLDKSGTMPSIANSFRELSEAMDKTKKDEKETTEEAEEENSKLVDVLSSMADTIDSVVSRKSDLKSIGTILSRTGVTFSQGFVDEMLNSSGQFAGAITDMANLTDEQLQNMVDAFNESELMEQINELTDSVDGSDNSFVEALKEAGISINDFAKNADKLGLTLDDISSKVSDFASSVSDGFSKMELDGQTTLEEFKDNLVNNYTVAQEWSQNVSKVFGSISGFGDSEAIQNFRKQVLEGGFEKWGQIIADLAESSQEEIMGFIDMLDYVSRQGQDFGLDITGSILGQKEMFVSSGQSIADGIAQGLGEGTNQVEGATLMMCESISSTVQSYFGIASPSKLMAKIGGYLVEGLSRGIDNDVKLAENSALTLSNSILDYLEKLNNDDFVWQPRIVPVLDTTDMANKMALLNSEIANTPSSYSLGQVDSISQRFRQNGYGSAANTMLIKNSLDRLSDKIDSIDPDNFGVTYQQNNYSPKALTTADIYRKTKSQLSRYKSKNSNGANLLR